MSEIWISCSGGVESTTLCLLFGHKAKAVFADAGWEHRLMYERLGLIERTIRARQVCVRALRRAKRRAGVSGGEGG